LVSIDIILVYSPEKELQVLTDLAKVGKEIDWKPVIILSAAYLEKFGKDKLKRYLTEQSLSGVTISFKDTKSRLRKKDLEELSLYNVIKFLFGLSLIKKQEFNQMDEIRKERNTIVHTKGIPPLYVGNKANDKYEKMVNNTLDIIKSLKK
jgi:neutral trehalase